ncbi:lamin tail domain-containing protein, partial [Microbacterium sp.]|uniref:lamin tail domain-containing protein n=1 Tax=Microbacterium sp. TaxID=51671 RepID=UPI003735029B
MTLSAAGLAFAPSAATAAVDAESTLVISEVYGGGGNSGAPLSRDFIELANTGDESVDLTGYSVQYASATGSSWQVTPLGAIELPAGEQLLIGQASGSNTSLPGVDADVEGTIAMSGSGAKVALVSSETPLAGASGIADLDQVVDLVGWGSTASAFAGTAPAPGTTNATSVSRDAEFSNT